MSDCLISVIVPMYNSAAYIEDCIKSLEAQTFIDYEVIFIDDGSTDNTVELVYQNAQKLPNYTVIKQENKHAGVARNTGIKHANGKFITCLDSDDCFEPSALEILYQTAMETGADVVRATGFEYDTDGARTDISWSLNKQIVRNHQVFTWKDISQNIFLLSAGNPWGMLVRRDLID